MEVEVKLDVFMEQSIYDKFAENPIIAAIRTDSDIDDAIESDIEIVFILKSDITNYKNKIRRLKQHNKIVFIHIDLIDGLGDGYKAIEFINDSDRPDGIISTKSNRIVEAKQFGLITIQRTFLVDSSSIRTAVANAKKIKPDALEIMPGIIPTAIKKIKRQVNIPIITGGMIDSKEQVIGVLEAGAISVSVSKKEIWAL